MAEIVLNTVIRGRTASLGGLCRVSLLGCFSSLRAVVDPVGTASSASDCSFPTNDARASFPSAIRSGLRVYVRPRLNVSLRSAYRGTTRELIESGKIR
jgi:hypothetical protein